MPERPALKTTAVACLVLTFLFASLSFAQERREGSTGFGMLRGTDSNPLEQLSRVSTGSVPLEGPVDPDEYVVGPGDLFHVSIGGPRPVLVTAPVSADGYLLLPESGAVRVSGQTLTEARRIAQASLRESFRNVNVEVTLSQPRQFFVHVSGAVPVPGRYLATPVARLATVLNIAFADTSQAPVSNAGFRPSLRNVRLIHREGTEESVDLLRYFSTGNPEHNPYLQDGDVISVPAYQPDYDAVFVSGSVAFPGTYDYREEDTLHDLLIIATGHNPPSGFERVRLTRANEDGTVAAEIYDASSAGNEIYLRPRDQIFVLAEETVRGTADITGWVNFPGTYSVVPGKTTIRDLIELGGGLREGALARGAYLERLPLGVPEAVGGRSNRFEQNSANFAQTLRADSLAMLRNMRLAGMDFIGRSYLAQELRTQNRVSIDLRDVLAGDAPPVYLQNGDRVHVPRDENTVFVFGQVNRPGYVAHAPGRDVAYYVAESGGRSELAGEAYVIETGTGRYVDAAGAYVQSGDMIFVDRSDKFAATAQMQQLVLEEQRLEIERQRDRAERRSRVVQTAIQTIGTAAAIITSYLLLRRELQ